jgi:hypothetical protein
MKRKKCLAACSNTKLRSGMAAHRVNLVIQSSDTPGYLMKYSNASFCLVIFFIFTLWHILMGVWQGVTMDSLKFHPGPLCSTFLWNSLVIDLIVKNGHSQGHWDPLMVLKPVLSQALKPDSLQIMIRRLTFLQANWRCLAVLHLSLNRAEEREETQTHRKHRSPTSL